MAVVEHRRAERAYVVRHVRQLVAGAAAGEAEPVDQLELIVAQQMEPEPARVEDHIVTVIELVDVHGHAGDRGHDGGPHRAVGDHPVALAVALRRDCHHGRREGAEQLIHFVGVHEGIIIYSGSPRTRPRPPPTRIRNQANKSG